MSSNIIAAWMEIATEKHGSISKGVRYINMICGSKICTSNIYDMREGKRNVPPCVSGLILNEVLLTELKSAGADISKINFEQLRDRLTLPQRERKYSAEIYQPFVDKD